MLNNNRTYIIMNYSDLTDAMVAKTSITDRNLLRRSVSGVDRVVVSWVGKAPNGLGSYQKYTNDQIVEILNDQNGDWYTPPYEP